MIHHKSIHPVEVKRISVRLWSLRAEIESALERRMKECDAAGVPLYIEDIKAFYKLDKSAPLPENVVSLSEAKKPEDLSAPEVSEDKKTEVPTPEATPEASPSPEATTSGTEGKTLEQAESIVSNQEAQGIENKPNPILQRPFVRQPPDLDKISYGFTFLSDINMDSVLVFTQDHFLQGQSVFVEFLIPQNFSMTAEVSYSNHFARTSRIISQDMPKYRVQCKFKFLITGERDQLRNLLKSIEPNIPTPKKKEKKEIDLDSLEI